MNVTKEVLDNCEVLMTVEIDDQRKAKLLEKAARRISKGVKIPGFRPGKAPYNYIVNRFGIEALQEEAMEELTKDVFQEAIKAADITPFALASLDSIAWEPLVMKVKIPVEPVVELSDYKDIRLELPEVEISDEKVDEQLEEMREHYVTYAPVERSAQPGDLVSALVTEKDVVSGDILKSEEREIKMIVVDDEDQAGLDMVTPLLGLSVGEETTFTHIYLENEDEEFDDEDEDDDKFDEEDDEEELNDDDDDEDDDVELDGKEVEITIKVNAVKAKEALDLNDDFAALVGDYDSLDALKTKIREDMISREKHQAEHKLIDQMIEKIAGEAKTIKWPLVMEEDELDSVIESQANRVKRMGIDFDTFLKYQNKTHEIIREELRENVRENIRHSLVLSKIADQENLSVDREEIIRQAEMMVMYSGGTKQAIETFQSPAALTMLATNILKDKARQKLLAIAKGETEVIEAPVKAEAEVVETDEAPADTLTPTES